MKIQPIKTHRIIPGEPLLSLIEKYLFPKEEDIVVVTSKIISLCENRIVTKESYPDKRALIQQESEAYLETELGIKHGVCLTLKNNILIPSAGIDESNIDNGYILYPKDIPGTAKLIWEFLREKTKIKKLGVIVTDSHTTIARRGVLGIGIGWCGFKPLYSYIGKEDCFGKPLRVTMANHLDALAVAAVHVMGEGAECTPLAMIQDAKKIEFQDSPPTKTELSSICIPPQEDLYGALFHHPDWVWKDKTDFHNFSPLRQW